MLNEPLPTLLDVRKAAVRGATITGTLKPRDLMRFLPLVEDAESDIFVEMTFSQDEDNRYLVHLVIRADVVVLCQRCLEIMPLHLSSDCALAIVWTEEEAAHLQRHLDPVIVKDTLCNLWQIVEDELILSLPPYNFHAAADCRLDIDDFAGPEPKQDISEDKPNPFNVLEQLKSGKSRQQE
jgi:uncharacterized protein